MSLVRANLMSVLVIIGGFSSVFLLAWGHWLLAILIYVASGFGWVWHDCRRPLSQMPMWTAGGSLVRVMVVCLWPLRAAELTYQRWRAR